MEILYRKVMNRFDVGEFINKGGNNVLEVFKLCNKT